MWLPNITEIQDALMLAFLDLSDWFRSPQGLIQLTQMGVILVIAGLLHLAMVLVLRRWIQPRLDRMIEALPPLQQPEADPKELSKDTLRPVTYLLPIAFLHLTAGNFWLNDNAQRILSILLQLLAIATVSRGIRLGFALNRSHHAKQQRLLTRIKQGINLLVWTGGGLWVVNSALRENHALMEKMTYAIGAVVTASLAYVAVRYGLSKPLLLLVRKTRTQWDDILVEQGFGHALAWLAPLSVLWVFASAFEGASFLYRIIAVFVEIVLLVAAARLLRTVGIIYDRGPHGRDMPIKGYLELAGLGLWIVGIFFIIGTILNQSPWALLSGIGAMTAVLMLVFRDTILSFVASVQIATNDIIRIGDWIQFPKFNADGNVIDLRLHVVKIQNFDKTITAIPTYRFITDSFQNWRGMEESGGRRIKRALLINLSGVRFLSVDDIERLKKIRLIEGYLAQKEQDLREHNQPILKAQGAPINGRQLTNLGTFRAYAEAFIASLPSARKDLTLMVRQLPPTEHGLPLEVYLFTTEQALIPFEAVQADIFDHLLAALPIFGLSAFQSPSGQDLQRVASAEHQLAAPPSAPPETVRS